MERRHHLRAMAGQAAGSACAMQPSRWREQAREPCLRIREGTQGTGFLHGAAQGWGVQGGCRVLSTSQELEGAAPVAAGRVYRHVGPSRPLGVFAWRRSPLVVRI